VSQEDQIRPIDFMRWYEIIWVVLRKQRNEDYLRSFLDSPCVTVRRAYKWVAVVHHDIVQRLRNKASRHRAES
jgi:hypothetical protein